VKKRLDNYRNRTYTGARYTKKSRRRTTTGAPAPKFSESQAFFRKFQRGMFHVEHPGPNENGSHLASWSHKTESRFLIPRFLFSKSIVCHSESITRSFNIDIRS